MSARAEGRQIPAIAVRDVVRRGREIGVAVRDVAATGARYIMTRHGEPVAALVSLADLNVLAAIDESTGYSLRDLKQLAAAEAEATTTDAPAGAEQEQQK